MPSTYNVGDVIRLNRDEYERLLIQVAVTPQVYERILARMTQPLKIVEDLGNQVYRVQVVGRIDQGQVYNIAFTEEFPIGVDVIQVAPRVPFAKRKCNR